MNRFPLRRGLQILGILGAFGLLYCAVFRVIPRILPWDGQQNLEEMEWSREILDRSGEVIQVRPVNEDGLRRLFLPFDRIPRDLLTIVRISEDRRFYLHPGVDPPALIRAARKYAGDAASAGGASTITMQLARIISPRTPGEEVTAGVKIREIRQALQIESRYSKKEILELYINLVPFGRNIEGYPAAARLFFGRNLDQLSPGELCLLTVIPRAPVYYDPFLNPDNSLRAAAALAEKALKKPAGSGEEAISRLPERPVPWPFEAPHFTLQVLESLDGMDKRSGERRAGREPVITTLNLEIHREARKLLKYHVDIAGDYRISNGAMILADPNTMEVLAYVGSADFYNETASGQIDGAAMLREPGSTLKPLLYADAIESGWTASTILPDIPMEFGGEFIYSPRNYNEQYHGPVRLRQALAASLNIPAVYALERLGVESFTEKLITLGFDSLIHQRSRLGVSLAVGGGEVSLAELVQGYGALYSGGTSRNLRYIGQKAGSAGNQPDEGRRAWSAETADIITHIISHSDDRVSTFGRGGPVRFDYPAAIKTGTSNQFNNIWAVGFTSDLIGAVWMGNFDGSTVMAAPGSSLPAAVLHEAFDAWSEKGDLPRYTELEIHQICSLSGMAAAVSCPYVIEELFTWGSAPPPCTWHGRDGIGGVRYPQEFAAWARSYGYSLEFSEAGGPEIISPLEGAVYYRGAGEPGSIRIRLGGSGPAVLSRADEVLYRGALPAELFWPLEEGIITFSLEQGERRVSRRIEVR